MVLTAGVISLISAASNSATLSTTSASGGTGPYTQQWYRDTSGAGFTPGIGNIIPNATALIVNNGGLVPNTQYFFKVVYTDATTSKVTSSAFIVTTLPASQGMNQFTQMAILGSLDLQSGPKNVVSAQIDATQLTLIYPGQPVKFVNSQYGIPALIASGIDMPNGYVIYDQKSENFSAGARCEIARTLSCMWLYATTAIARGSMVILDPDVASGVQQITGSSTLPIVGEAFDQAVGAGQLIRVILNVPSNVIDIATIVSNILEIDSVLTENLLTQNLLKSIVDGVPSNQVAIQIPVSSPTNNNLMAMDASGNNKDSGVSVTTDPMSNDDSHLPTTEAMQSAILAGVVAGYAYQGPYDASSGVYPSVNKIGGPIAGGEFWIITVAGTLPGPKNVEINDEILSLIDVPGQTPTNWTVRIGTGVRKFNGRDGLVDPEYGDYDVTMIPDAAALSGAAFIGEVTVLTPTNPTDAARKDYVDSGLAGKINSTTGTAIQKGNGSGGLTAAVSGTDYQPIISSPTSDAIVTMTAGGVVKNSGVTITTSSTSNSNTEIMTSAAFQTAIAAIAASDMTFIGVYDASVNTFPTVGSGTSGAVEKGDTWSISVAGTLGGTAVYPGDTLLSIINNPGQTSTNWAINSAVSKTYVDNQLAFKANLNGAAFTGTVSVLTPTNSTDAARKDYVDTGLSTKEPTITVLPVAKGGTNISSYTIGDLIFASAAGILSKLTDVAIGSVLASGGIGAAPAWSNAPAFTGNPTAPNITAGDSSTKLSNTNYVDTGLATKEPTITVLPVSKGGTNIALYAIGDILFASATNALSKLAAVAVGSVLVSAGTGTAPAWSNAPAFGGNPTAPNIASSDNSTKLANTNFVQILIAALAASGFSLRSTNYDASGNAFPSTGGSGTSGAIQKGDIYIIGVAGTLGGTSVSIGNWVTALINAPGTTAANWNINGAISHSLSISSTTLTSTVNSKSSTAQVSPSGQSITSAITFTLLSEIIIVCAPSVNAVGNYGLRLKDSSGNELDILFNVLCNQNTYYNQSQIQIVKVNDSQGVVTESNISNYLLFRGYLRNSTPNSYFVVTLSMPYTLLYSNPLSMTLTQYSFSYLNENTTITNMITTDISNLVSVYQPDLIFKMQLFYIPVSISNPQGYNYFVSTNTVYQSSVNPLTGALSALSPASITVTGATNFAATTLRNYAYCTAGSNVIMLKIATNGTLTITAPTISAQSGSTGIAIEPTDRFLYVAGTSSGFIQVFSITKSSGLITSIQTVNAAFGITQIAVHPSGKYLYVINQSSNVVYMYNIDPSTGFLTAMTTPTVGTGTTPGRIKVHPNGNFAYVTNNGAGTITIYTIDTTGKLTFSATYTPVGFSGIKGLCIHPNGNFIFFTSESTNSLQQSTINTGTGAIGAPSTGQTINGARDCSMDFSGTYLYVVNNTNTRIDEYSISPTTGATTYITSLTTSANSTDIVCV